MCPFRNAAHLTSGPCRSYKEYHNLLFLFLVYSYWVVLRKGYGDLYKAPTKEGRRKRKANRREREREIRSSLLILDLKDGK